MNLAVAVALVLLIGDVPIGDGPVFHSFSHFGDRPQQGAVWESQLGGVEATGMKRLTSAQVAAIASMKVGTNIRPADVEAARKRLIDSGYFSSVGYSYRNRGYLLVVTFQVEEVAWQTPVVFDNFVDQTDAQLIAAIAKDVPSFDGKTPDREVVLKRIASSLERVASAAKDPGTVAFALILTEEGGTNHWRFRLERTPGPLTVCSVALAGVADPLPEAVNDRKAALIGKDYSRDTILKFARETFVPMLTQPVSVKSVEAVRAPATDSCPRGVAVTVKMGAALSSRP